MLLSQLTRRSALLTGTITEVWQQAPNYSSSYHVTPYYNMPYYTQNSQYYNYNYNTQQQIHLPRQAPAPETVGLFNGVAAPETARLPNGVVALYTPSGGTIQLNPQLALPNGNAAFQKSPQTYVQPYVNMNIHQRSYMSPPKPRDLLWSQLYQLSSELSSKLSSYTGDIPADLRAHLHPGLELLSR